MNVTIPGFGNIKFGTRLWMKYLKYLYTINNISSYKRSFLFEHRLKTPQLSLSTKEESMRWSAFVKMYEIVVPDLLFRFYY